MIRQMSFKLPLILSVVAAVFNNDEAQPRTQLDLPIDRPEARYSM
jgi:hypothetical protein